MASAVKDGGDPVTAADLELDHVLKESLLRPGEGWLSEETADDLIRLECDLTWVVDPLDGTKEFIEGLPEFCTSIAAVANGRPIAGGVLNPAAGMRIVGAVGSDVTVNGHTAETMDVSSFEGLRVLASRSECKRGTWTHVADRGIEVVPMGSVAYKFARVAAGLDPLTWTPVPKHDWDVAAGAALIASAGGRTVGLDGKDLLFNRPDPWMSGAIAVPKGIDPFLTEILVLAQAAQ